MKYQYKTKGVCSRAMEVEIDDNGIITNATIIGGCQGNTTGVAALVKGYKATEAISRLKGIQCGARGTSCPDQLATCLESGSRRKQSLTVWRLERQKGRRSVWRRMQRQDTAAFWRTKEDTV